MNLAYNNTQATLHKTHYRKPATKHRMPSVPRRQFLAILLGATTTGCLEQAGFGQSRGGEILATPVETSPANVTPTEYPQPGHENPYITDAVTTAAEEDAAHLVIIPPEDFQAVEQTYHYYSPENANPHVRYDDQVLKLMIVRYE